MSGIQELIAIAKEMGLEGEAIQKFVEKQQEVERQARAERREEQERIYSEERKEDGIGGEEDSI